MKYLSQMMIILLLSFLGEGLHAVLPFPIPASIYGMVLLFLALLLKIIKPDQVNDSAHFLVSIMGVLFVCPAVGLLSCWDLVKDSLVPVAVITAVSLVLVFFVSGRVTQLVMHLKEGRKNG